MILKIKLFILLSIVIPISYGQEVKKSVHINFWSIELNQNFNLPFLSKINQSQIYSIFWKKLLIANTKSPIILNDISCIQDSSITLPGIRLNYHRHTNKRLGLNFSLGYQKLPSNSITQSALTQIDGYYYQGPDIIQLNPNFFHFGLGFRFGFKRIPFNTALTLGLQYSLVHSKINRTIDFKDENRRIIYNETGSFRQGSIVFKLGLGKRYIVKEKHFMEVGARINFLADKNNLQEEAERWLIPQNSGDYSIRKMNPLAFNYASHYFLKNNLNYEIYFSFGLFNIRFK
ncbi:hypothetical protein [Lishizhenia sp.]|uniref:hypothetical protein n=1 Tax=Lishizhenia sp. TaxID=2497594 RepID=UPI00299D44CB|nr:hypothetical protein [Lishizhenia sp.]MDX1444772.1 hypothetical protein [Lishizhenia sp.]